MPENSCYTYFAIKGEFNPDDITRRIGLNPSKVWKKGDKRNNGTEYDFSYWEFGFCDEYDVVTEKQMQKVDGGVSLGLVSGIAAAVVFVVGFLSGYTNPSRCHN